MFLKNLLSSADRYFRGLLITIGGAVAFLVAAVIIIITLLITSLSGIITSLFTFIMLVALFIGACIADLLPNKKDKP